MLGLSPFMRGHQMARTWLALMGASLATFIVHDPVGYFVIDACAAALVMSRPSSIPQKMIGALFTLMALFDIGYVLSPQSDWGLFTSTLRFVGWVQWAVLAGWVGHDIVGRFLRWSGPARGAPAAFQRRIR
jgi:hypothetical protein